jgi:rod shape-determining protein MreC
VNILNLDLRKAAIVVLVIALPLLSINMKRSPGEDPWYMTPIAWASGQLQYGFATFADEVRSTTGNYLNLLGVKKLNSQFRLENDELRSQMGRLTELATENERLRSLLEFKATTKIKMLSAEVISRDISPDHHAMRINRGYLDGLKKYQGVITTKGVVGYIISLDANSSRVLAVNDRTSAIDSLVQRTRARGTVTGRGVSSAKLKYLQRADDVSKGDLVVTSGFRGSFPKGFPIGRVLEVRQTAYGISQEAQIETIVNSANVEELFVILDAGREDMSERFGGGSFGPPLLSKMNPESIPAMPNTDGTNDISPGAAGSAGSSR